MPKKSDVQITPENFLDSYKPVSPQRKGGNGDAETQAELRTVEPSTNGNVKNKAVILQERQNAVEMTPLEYRRIFMRPNQGESMRYGNTFYVSKNDMRKIKALMHCFGEGYDKFPLSVFIHNLLEYHFSEFSDLINEMIGKQSFSNPFNTDNE